MPTAILDHPSSSQGIQPGQKIGWGHLDLDGTNPTPIATGLSTIDSVVVSLRNNATPGVGTSVLTTDISAGTVNVYAWKVTSNANPTLVASTGTETIDWIALGT